MALKDALEQVGFISHGPRMSHDIMEKHYENGIVQIVHIPHGAQVGDTDLTVISDEPAPIGSKDALNQDLEEDKDRPTYTTRESPDGKSHIITDPMGNDVLTLPPTEFAVIGLMYENALRTKTIAYANTLMFGYVLGQLHAYMIRMTVGQGLDAAAMETEFQKRQELADSLVNRQREQDDADASRLMTPEPSAPVASKKKKRK